MEKKIIRCRPLHRVGPGHELPPWEQIINQEAVQMALEIDAVGGSISSHEHIYVEIITDSGRADYEVTSRQNDPHPRFNLRRRT